MRLADKFSTQLYLKLMVLMFYIDMSFPKTYFVLNCFTYTVRSFITKI